MRYSIFRPRGAPIKKGHFWDYIAYQQDSGILIVAETEFDSKINKLLEDFDKLLYAKAPIKVFMFWLDKNEESFEEVVAQIAEHMASCSED